MTEQQIAAAERRVERARARLTDALGALKDRLLPGNIARNVAHGIAEKGQDAAKAGVDAVRARPAAAIGIAALAGLIFARKPIVRALTGEESDPDDETPAGSPRSAANPSAED